MGLTQLLLFSLIAVVALVTGWWARTRSSRVVFDQLQREVTRLRAIEAVANERSVRIGEVQERYIEATESLQNANSEVASLRTAAGVAQAELREHKLFAKQRLAALEQQNIEFSERFESISSKIFVDNNRRMAEVAESHLSGLLAPLKEQIGDFRKRVEDTYDKDSQDRHLLKAEIVQLKSLNERISHDAINLTNALRGDNKALGSWGELVLERVLEAAGLRQGTEYEREISFTDASGKRLRPDVIIHLPDGKDIIVDSKVSVVAFEKALAHSGERGRWLGQHVKALRRHCDGLSSKSYESIDGLNSLDFVLMFIPVDAAFQAAIEYDPQLYQDAFDRDVVLVSPASLMVTCRTIQNVWRSERQNRNALQIARKAGELIDKFGAFTAELDKVGSSLANASDSFESARRKLSTGRGNLIGRAKAIQHLGVSGKTELIDAD